MSTVINPSLDPAKSQNTASFVLRFTQETFRDEQAGGHVRWRGHIRHVQGDREERFTNFADAVTFIQKNLTALTFDTFSGDESMSQEKIMRESFKLWEQFAAHYQDIMSTAVEQTLKQSEAVTQQLELAAERTRQAWGIGTNEQAQMHATLQRLQEQVESLNSRVESLEKSVHQRG